MLRDRWLHFPSEPLLPFQEGRLGVHTMGPLCTCGGIVDSTVFQQTVHYPGGYSAGYHAVLEDEMVVTVRWDQVSGVQLYET